jgi:hypothetical protein
MNLSGTYHANEKEEHTRLLTFDGRYDLEGRIRIKSTLHYGIFSVIKSKIIAFGGRTTKSSGNRH